MSDKDFPGIPEVYEKVLIVDSNGVPIKAIPDVLITSGGENGIAPRIRVDPGQTGFFAGRMFRAFIRGDIPVAGPAHYFRFTSPVDFIIWTQNLELTQGALQLEIFAAPDVSGTWTDITTMLGLNRMAERPTPYYVRQAAIQSGGTFTGGTLLDVIEVRSSQNNSNANNVGGAFNERGLPAGAYYGRLSTLTGGLPVNDPAHYIYTILWEER